MSKIWTAVLCIALLVMTGCGKEDDHDTTPGSPGSTPTTPTEVVDAVSLTVGNTSLVADGSSSAILRATVTSTNGPLPGVTVDFSTSLGTLSEPSAVTDADGIAQVMLVAPSQIGSADVQATAAGIASGSQTVNFLAGPPVVPILNLAPTTVNPGGTSTLTVNVLDAQSNPVAGETLRFNVETNSSGGTLGALVSTTDANGQATVVYTAGSLTGDDTISVTTTNAQSASATLTVDAAAVVVESLTLTADTTSLTADGQTTSNAVITATVLDIDGQPAVGIPVTFADQSATALGGSLSILNGTTDSNGKARAVYTAGTNIGNANISATASGLSRAISIALVAGPPASLNLATTPATVNFGDQSQVSAQLNDSHGNPVAGATVTFAISVPDNATGGSVTGSATTDLGGTAIATYTAGNTAGTDTITATASNGLTATTTVAVEAVFDLASLAITNITPGTVLPASDSAALTVTALDSSGAAAVGIDLVAVATGAASIDSGATQTTDSAGEATFTLSDASAENVVLRIADAAGTTSVEQKVYFGPTLSFTKSSTQAIGSTDLTAYLRDANAIGISGIPLDFLPVYGDADNLITPTSATTDANGSITLTAEDPDDNGGTIDVTAQVNSAPAINGATTVTFESSTANYGLDAQASFTVADVGDTTTIRATVTNLASGQPAEGQPVTFTADQSATLSDGTTSGVQTLSATTDASGQASVTVSDSVAENVFVTVDSGQVVEVPVYFGADLRLTPAVSESVADGNTVRSLTATVVDANNARIQGIPVNFNVPLGSALLSTGSATTDIDGEATVDVTNSLIETATIQATAGALVPATADIDYVPGDPSTLTLSSAPANTTALSLFGQATITATGTDLLGNNVADNTPVTFAVSGGASAATITPSATTSGGTASATLSAGSVSGDLTVTATAGGASKSITFTVAPSDAGSITVENVEPEFVQHLGQPGQQTSVITFSVRDPAGNPVADGTDVTISLDPLQLNGGELLSDGTSPFADSVTTQTVAGQASVTFRSGIVSGTVDVTATVATPLSTDISTVALVTVLSGEPDSFHLPVSGGPHNVPSLLYDGCTSSYQITVGDRYGNPVPQGTNVSFMVEPGCGLIGSSSGFSTTTDEGLVSEPFTHGTVPGSPAPEFPTPPLSVLSNCTVVAYMNGDEGFEDINGNGVWDAGIDNCSGDQGEPYVDANDDGVYNAGELYIDVNSDGAYTPANGTCETDTTIWKSFGGFLASGAMTTFNIAPTTFDLQIGESQTFTVTVSDDNGAPPIAGTSLEVSTSAGTLVGGGESVMADTSTATPWTRSFALMSDIDPGASLEQAIITVNLTFPGGTCGDNGPNQTLEIAGLINQPPPGVAPSVAWTVPNDGATNIPVDGEITIAFDTAMNPISVTSATVSATCGGTAYAFDSVAASGGDTEFTLSHAAGSTFPAATTCTITVSDGVRDTGGVNMAAPYSFSFTTQ